MEPWEWVCSKVGVGVGVVSGRVWARIVREECFLQGPHVENFRVDAVGNIERRNLVTIYLGLLSIGCIIEQVLGKYLL